MLQLHYHLMALQCVDSVGFCKRAAAQYCRGGLYEGFGYEESECMFNYYQDGEVMRILAKKRLSAVPSWEN
jgi:hypothetical protein